MKTRLTDMRIARPFMIGAAIVASLLAAYIGAYWFAEKSAVGSEFFHSDGSSFRYWPKWTHRAMERMFVPAIKAEQYLIERRERSRYMGDWVAESGNKRIEIGDRLEATVYGFSDDGFMEGSKHLCQWRHLPGGETSLVVQAPRTSVHLQIDVFSIDNPERRNCMSVCPINPYALESFGYKLWRR